MIRSREGVIGLPLKLTVSFMILALMVPPIMSSVGDIQDGMDEERMVSCARDLADRLEAVGSKGPGYRTWHQIDIPDGGGLSLGGEEGYIIRILMNGEQVDRLLLARPVIGEETLLTESVMVEISNAAEGVSVRGI